MPINEPPYCGTPLDGGFPWESTPVADLWWVPLPALFTHKALEDAFDLGHEQAEVDRIREQRDALVGAIMLLARKGYMECPLIPRCGKCVPCRAYFAALSLAKDPGAC
jgi:hypothetical protein